MLPGDKIIKVNGADVTGDKMDEAVDIMRGEPGTTVNVTIYRESELKKFDLTLERKIVEVPTVSYKMLENSIGYIELTQFDGVSYEQFKKAYDALNQAGQKGLILDLRYNPGGRLDIVEQIADLLIPKGPIVYVEYKGKGKKVDKESDANAVKVPLAVLVNGYSASASEVLTGAIKDYQVGKVIGTTTFGKGIVQSLIPLQDGSGIKVTTAKYYTPSGVCIHGIGIEPDYVVELPEELKNKLVIDPAKDTQLQKAIEVVNQQMK
jgi:carboxyl-terminal processing protease